MKGEGNGIGRRGLLIIAIAFVLVIGALFFAISGGLFRSERAEEVALPQVTDVLDGRSVMMTVRGPIVANEDAESYSIEVGIDSRTITAFTGYERNAVSSQTLTNNRQAYTQFVYALQRADFAVERNASEEASNEQGVCAKGKLFVFEILENDRTISRLWTSSCSGERGTLNAQPNTLKSLFDVQIPDRRNILESLSLN